MRTRVYFSAATAVLSVFLAVQILHSYPEWPLLYLSYFIFTFIITTVAYLLRLRLSTVEAAKLQKRDSYKTEESHAPWKALTLLFLTVLAFIFLPVLLAGFLNPKSWFILIAGLTSGISIAEVLFHFHARGNLKLKTSKRKTTLGVGGNQKCEN